MRRLDARQGRAGLTAREVLLLVALGIAAAVMLWPWMRGKQRERSSAVSARNLQQWGIALNLHLMDYDQQLPHVGSLPLEAEPVEAWYNSLPIYLEREPLGAMPPATRPGVDEDSIWVDPFLKPPPGEEGFVFSYGMNRHLQPDPGAPAYRIYDLTAPESTVFLTEKSGADPGVTPDAVEFRHTVRAAKRAKLAHILFCDGHVSFGSRFELVENPEALAPNESLAPVSWVPFPGAPSPE